MDNQSFDIVTNRIDTLDLSPRANAMAHGLLLGDKQYFTYCEKQEMRNAGMSHILAVSGLHIGILFAVLYFSLNVLRWFGLRKLHKLIIISVLWLYVIMIGCPVSAVRAALMLGLASLSWALERYTSGIRTLVSAAVIMVAYDYHQLFDVGFQLSFLATLGILFVCHDDYAKDVCSGAVLLKVTLAAQCMTFPVVAYHFHIVPVLGCIQGLLVIPLLSVLVYLLLLYLLFPSFVFLSFPIEWITDWIFMVADVSSRLENWLLSGHLALYPARWEAIIWELAIFALFLIASRYRNSRYRL